MPLSVAQLTTALRSTTGQDDITLPSVDTGSTIGCLTFLNRSFWEIANKFNFRVAEVDTTFPTVANTFVYPTPVLFDAISDVSILDPSNGNYNLLEQMDMAIFRQKQSTNSNDVGIPTNYIRHGSSILLYPTPDQVYTIQVDYLQTLSDLVSGNPPVPREWHELILYGAVWRVFSDVNGDLARAQWYTNKQVSLINSTVPVQAKEEMDYSNAGVNVKGRTY